MASDQTAAILVARFLKANHYEKSLEAFLRETNLTDKAATTNAGDWTLEKVLEEKVQFDTSIKFERKDNEGSQGWSQPAPSVPCEPELQVSTNVLCVRGHSAGKSLAITTANNNCAFVMPKAPYKVLPVQRIKADSPILSTIFLSDFYTASTTMSGKLMIHEYQTGFLSAECRDHSKWVVQVASWQMPGVMPRRLIATAGWDQKVHVYSYACGSKDIGPPSHTITLQSNPMDLVFVTNPDTNKLYLIVSRRDSSFLFYYRVDMGEASSDDNPDSHATITISHTGRQNLAPHSNAWVAFTPSALALHPSDTTLLAIATSHLPHLKVILVRLLFPDPDTPTPYSLTQTSVPQTAASQARADLALQDREDAAITIQVSTQAPQTPYSTPQICWRPDGTGVWVNGDDGVVRGVEVKTGKVVALLRAHEAASKVRTLWAGYLGNDESNADDRREVLVSGGFDRRVFVWEVSGND